VSAESTLIESGINLLLTGMTVVFFFLLTLIISIYLLKFLFSRASQTTNVNPSDSDPEQPVSKIHERIIKEVMERHQA